MEHDFRIEILVITIIWLAAKESTYWNDNEQTKRVTLIQNGCLDGHLTDQLIADIQIDERLKRKIKQKNKKSVIKYAKIYEI